MKFSDFKNSAEMPAHFGLMVQPSRFIAYDQVQPLALPTLVLAPDYVVAPKLAGSIILQASLKLGIGPS
ncbi:MAG: hypothetical protein MUC97_15360 [Bernardetiaceae bacterium]|nr:hypothetical protein [Bernardetiaceae bacterium]